MTNLQEMARLVREELLTLIQPVQLLSVNPSKATGEVSGRFRSNGTLFDYAIKGGTVRYRPLGSGGRQDSADEIEAVGRLDAGGRKPRNCTKGFSCGNTCIQKGRTCKAKGGAAAQKLSAIVKYTGGGDQAAAGKASKGAAKAAPAKTTEKAPAASKGAAKAPTLQEVKSGVMGYFGVKSVAALKANEDFVMATAGDDENPLKSKEDWLKLYRTFVGVPKNERNLPDSPTVINGIDVLKNFRPWHVFGLDPKKATNDDIRKAFRKLIIKHHPDQGGDPRVVERLKTMRDSLLALRPEPKGKRKDSADDDLAVLLGSLIASRQQLQARQQAFSR